MSLSSNCIDKIVNLPNLRNLEILSLARNNIKKIGGLDEIGIKLKIYLFLKILKNFKIG